VFNIISACIKPNRPRGRDGKPRVFRGEDSLAARPHYEFSLISVQESVMVKSAVAKIARMLLYVVVFVLSLIVGTAISAVLMKAVEL
jgi:hypothetical protein